MPNWKSSERSLRSDVGIHPGLRSIELCAGYGGLGLGIELAVPGSRSVCLVERESFLIDQLVEAMDKNLMAQAPIHSDVKTFDGRPWRGFVDCITGGYPCQPFSIAGKRLGASDPRHLWPHIFRIVDEVMPAACFFENVDDHLNMGYDQVHADLERLGYIVEAGIFSSAETGASHVRERLYILAVGGDRQAVPSRSERHAGAEVCGTSGDGGGNRAVGNHVDGSGGSLESSNEPGLARSVTGQGAAGPQRPSRLLGEPKSLEHDRTNGGASRHPESRCGVGFAQGNAHCERGPQPQGSEPDKRGRNRDSGKPLGSPKGLRGDESGWRRSRGVWTGCSGEESQGVVLDDALCGRYGHPEQAIFSGRLPVEPPGRLDDECWRRVIENFPYLAPALAPAKSTVRGVADALAYRVDRVRAVGNGVDPVVAAVAFSTLWHRIHGGI